MPQAKPDPCSNAFGRLYPLFHVNPWKFVKRGSKMNICLVTSEIPGFGPSGGIGTAFHELAITLSQRGANVDILYTRIKPDNIENCVDYYEQNGINVFFIKPDDYVWNYDPPLAKSYAIYKTLILKCNHYDFIHFAEYGGEAFYTIQSKRLLGHFNETTIVIQTHGSTRWALSSNSSPLTHHRHILIDFMEVKSIQGADIVVSPSQYLLDWFEDNGVSIQSNKHVIPNLATSVERRNVSDDTVVAVDEVIMFGRHEFRKGLTTFCDALDRIKEELAERNVRVTFIGQPSALNEIPSEIYLTNRAQKWDFEIRVLGNLSRDRANSYIRATDTAVVVVPSFQENSPYTVLENLALGAPVITSVKGGARELMPDRLHQQMLFDGSPEGLSNKILDAIIKGINVSKPALSNSEVEGKWLELHRDTKREKKSEEIASKNPSVVLGVTHYERPEKLLQAVYSALDQTYTNTTVVVLDDGSKSPEARAALKRVERLITPSGGKLIIQQNGYLGAARNTIARETSSDYLIFLDDDDIALPHMVETLVRAAQRQPGSIIAPLNYAMEERRRGEALAAPEKFTQKLSYFISGGPASLMPFGNYLSTATALIPRAAFNSLGGYSELKGVGFEDFELYMRAVQQGVRVEALPEALYLYEVDRPSMVSSTPAMANLSRVLDVVDLAADKQAWKDVLSCIAAHEANQAVRGRALWLEKISPYNRYFERIRSHAANSQERFQALVEYAEAIGASGAAYAWKNANLPVGRLKPIPMFAFDGNIPTILRNKRDQPINSDIFPAIPYKTEIFGLAATFEKTKTTIIDWSIHPESAPTLNVKAIGETRWLNLEMGLNRHDLVDQLCMHIEIDLTTSRPLDGSVLIRLQEGEFIEDTVEQRYEIFKNRILRFQFHIPENWLDLLNAEARFVMFLPLSEMKIEINSVRCTARPRDLGLLSTSSRQA